MYSYDVQFRKFIKKKVKTIILQAFFCMRNEYFIYNQLIKIKYKIISKQNGEKKHCTRHWYDTNDRMNINNYSYIQCKTPTCYILSSKLYSYISYLDIHYNTKISTVKEKSNN